MDATVDDAGTPALDAHTPDAGRSPRCPSDPALVGCWNFDEDYTDGSGYGFDLTSYLTVLLPGRVGNAVYLAGAAALTRESAPELDAMRSVAFFARPDAPPGAGRQMFVDKNGVLAVRFLPGNRVECVVGNTSAGANGVARPAAWIHIACVGDPSGVTLYVNGSSVAYAAGATSPASSGDIMRFGEDAPDGGDQFVGFLDEFRAYSRALTPSEVLDLATATSL